MSASAFYCGDCGSEKCDQDSLERHIAEEHLDWLPFQCDYCKRRRPTFVAMWEHQTSVHKAKELNMITVSMGSREDRAAYEKICSLLACSRVEGDAVLYKRPFGGEFEPTAETVVDVPSAEEVQQNHAGIADNCLDQPALPVSPSDLPLSSTTPRDGKRKRRKRCDLQKENCTTPASGKRARRAKLEVSTPTTTIDKEALLENARCAVCGSQGKLYGYHNWFRLKCNSCNKWLWTKIPENQASSVREWLTSAQTLTQCHLPAGGGQLTAVRPDSMDVASAGNGARVAVAATKPVARRAKLVAKTATPLAPATPLVETATTPVASATTSVSSAVPPVHHPVNSGASADVSATQLTTANLVTSADPFQVIDSELAAIATEATIPREMVTGELRSARIAFAANDSLMDGSVLRNITHSDGDRLVMGATAVSPSPPIPTATVYKSARRCGLCAVDCIDLMRHVKSAHILDRLFLCSQCGFGSNSALSVDSHISSEHGASAYAVDNAVEYNATVIDLYQQCWAELPTSECSVAESLPEEDAVDDPTEIKHSVSVESLPQLSVVVSPLRLNRTSMGRFLCRFDESITTWSYVPIVEQPKKCRFKDCDYSVRQGVSTDEHVYRHLAELGGYRYICKSCDFATHTLKLIRSHMNNRHGAGRRCFNATRKLMPRFKRMEARCFGAPSSPMEASPSVASRTVSPSTSPGKINLMPLAGENSNNVTSSSPDEVDTTTTSPFASPSCTRAASVPSVPVHRELSDLQHMATPTVAVDDNDSSCVSVSANDIGVLTPVRQVDDTSTTTATPQSAARSCALCSKEMKMPNFRRHIYQHHLKRPMYFCTADSDSCSYYHVSDSSVVIKHVRLKHPGCDSKYRSEQDKYEAEYVELKRACFGHFERPPLGRKPKAVGSVEKVKKSQARCHVYEEHWASPLFKCPVVECSYVGTNRMGAALEHIRAVHHSTTPVVDLRKPHASALRELVAAAFPFTAQIPDSPSTPKSDDNAEMGAVAPQAQTPSKEAKVAVSASVTERRRELPAVRNCRLCGEAVVGQRNVALHVVSKHFRTPLFICPFVDCQFGHSSRPQPVARHIRSHHNSSRPYINRMAKLKRRISRLHDAAFVDRTLDGEGVERQKTLDGEEILGVGESLVGNNNSAQRTLDGEESGWGDAETVDDKENFALLALDGKDSSSDTAGPLVDNGNSVQKTLGGEGRHGQMTLDDDESFSTDTESLVGNKGPNEQEIMDFVESCSPLVNEPDYSQQREAPVDERVEATERTTLLEYQDIARSCTVLDNAKVQEHCPSDDLDPAVIIVPEVDQVDECLVSVLMNLPCYAGQAIVAFENCTHNAVDIVRCLLDEMIQSVCA